MRRKNTRIPRPAGLQSMTPGLYAQIQKAIRALAPTRQPVRLHA